MFSHLAPQPETHGAATHGQTPQVAVRDGNRLLCPCCGEVLLELNDSVSDDLGFEETVPEETAPVASSSADIPQFEWLPQHRIASPWDVIEKRQEAQKEAAWQAYLAHEKSQQEALYAQYLASDDPEFCADYLAQPIDPEVARYEFPAEEPPPLPRLKKAKPENPGHAKRRSPRPGTWRDVVLEAPYTYQQKRYMAWTYYRLKLQDLELQEKILARQTKIERLRSELAIAQEIPAYEAYLPSDDVPKVRPPVNVVEFDLLYWIEKVRGDQPWPQLESTRLKAVIDRAKERGPPC